MAILETLKNTAWTTLAAAISGSGDTTITVTANSAFPSSGRFRVKIDQEYLLVTAGAGTNLWVVSRGQEGSTAVAHPNGSLVYGVFTAGSLDHIISYHEHSGGSEGTYVTESWQPFAYPIGYECTGTYTSANNLAAAGGSLLVPIVLNSTMSFDAVRVWNTDTATARSWGWELYKQDGQTNNILTQVTVSNGYDTWTPSGASLRTLYAVDTPKILTPGIYWVLITNRHATSTFGVGHATSGTISNTRSKTKTLTGDGVITATYADYDVAFTPDGTKIVSVDNGGFNIYDPANDSVSTTQAVTGQWDWLCFSPDSAYAYAATRDSTGILKIPLASPASYSTLTVTGLAASGLGITTDGAWLYAPSTNSTIYLVRLSDFTSQGSFTIGTTTANSSWGIVMDPGGLYAYAPRSSSTDLKKIRLSDNTVVASSSSGASLSSSAGGICMSPDGARIWVTSATAGLMNYYLTSDLTRGTVNTTLGGQFTRVKRASSTYVYAIYPSGPNYSRITSSSGAYSNTTMSYTGTNAITLSPDDKFLYAGYSATGLQEYRTATNLLARKSLDATAATWTGNSYTHAVYFSGKPFGEGGW